MDQLPSEVRDVVQEWQVAVGEKKQASREALALGKTAKEVSQRLVALMRQHNIDRISTGEGKHITVVEALRETKE